MLCITIPNGELWDELRQEFVYTKERRLTLEHSLLSISKWEAKWEKPFLGRDEKTYDETVDYIKCMTLTRDVDPNVYLFLTDENIQDVNHYVLAAMTATRFSKKEERQFSREEVTSELIYHWMVSLNIPFECQKWHLNRLLTLIRVCNLKNQPPKKRSKRDIMAEHAYLNAKRKQQWHTKG